MEYENCGGGTAGSTGDNTAKIVIATLAIIILIVIMTVSYVTFRKEKLDDRSDEILLAMDVTMKEKGTIIDFKRTIKDSSFSPIKYMHLTDLYRQGKLTKSEVARILSDANL